MMWFEIVMLFMAWIIVGLLVVETCRIWRMWWLSATFLTVLLWPLVLLHAITKGKPHDH